MWCLFHDMHSGGSLKTDYAMIYLESDNQESAIQTFESIFDQNPEHVTCDCCGPDYSVSDYANLEQATGYSRNCAFVDGVYIEKEGNMFGIPSSQGLLTIAEYAKDPLVKIISKKDVPDMLFGRGI